MEARRSPTRVLVVDDHEVVRLGVRQLLSERWPDCEYHGAGALAEALDKAGQGPWDLLVVDLGLGGDSMLSLLPRLRERAGGAPVLILSSMPESAFAERCLHCGADGFVGKSALGDSLLQAAEAVLAGDVWVSPALRARLLRRSVGREAASAPAALTRREVEVLRLVADGRSTREIADILNRSVKTIESHKQSLKDKLQADTPAMLLRRAIDWTERGP
jgi:DNA-binding NarL/FixJ family response regulator